MRRAGGWGLLVVLVGGALGQASPGYYYYDANSGGGGGGGASGEKWDRIHETRSYFGRFGHNVASGHRITWHLQSLDSN